MMETMYWVEILVPRTLGASQWTQVGSRTSSEAAARERYEFLIERMPARIKRLGETTLDGGS